MRQLARPGARVERLPRVGDTVGGFLLEARLGSGSFGTVYRARRGDRLFALKLLYLPLAGAWAWRELEVVLRLHHVGLLGVECHGQHGAQPDGGPLFLYIVTDYVPGQSLEAWAEHTNPTARQVVQAVGGLTAQLVLAHSVGVVHRDLKPDNVVVRGEDGQPVLVDFGVGTFPGALKVTDGSPPGSALARSPELWRFRRERQPLDRYEATPRDDLWALGVLLYWLLVGAWPFEGSTEEELEDAVLHACPRAPHECNARVPPVLSEVCLRMLEKAPEARYADARAVREALEIALAGADATWEEPLCEAWEESCATTLGEGKRSWGQLVARELRVGQAARARPLRGRPPRPRSSLPPPVLSPGEPVPPVAEPVRTVRPGGVVLGALALLCAMHLGASLEPPREALLPGASATPVSFIAWMHSVQEVAPRECSLEGDGGAVPAWAPTAAPVAFVTPLKDGKRVKTSRKTSLSSQSKPLSRAVCTGALGALVAACPGAQVRTDPPSEPCPADSLASMKKLGLWIGEDLHASFPGYPYIDDEESLVTLREGTSVTLRVDHDFGTLPFGTLLMGRLIFGKQRVYGRFIEAQVPGGPSHPVCMELWDFGEGIYNAPGLFIEPDSAPGTANVNANPHVKPTERFK